MGTGQNENGGTSTGYQLPAVAWMMDDQEGEAEAHQQQRQPAAPAQAAPVATAPPGPSPLGPVRRAAGPVQGSAAAPDAVAAAAAAAVAPGAAPLAVAPPAPTPAPLAQAPAGPAPERAEPAGPGRVVRLTRLKRPAVAAAATVGMVLMGLPLVISHGSGSAQSLGDTDSAGLSRTDAPVTEPGTAPHPPAPGDVTASPSAAAGTPGVAPDAAADPAAAGAPGSVPGQPPAPGATAGPGAAVPAAGGAAVVPVTAPGNNPGTDPGRTTTPAVPSTPVAVPPVQPTPKPTTPPAAAPSYTGIGGAWCNSASVSFSQYGWWEGSHGWFTQTGGFAGASCNGKFTSMPMSGSATKDDGNSVVWTFRTAPVTSGTCKISVYIPNNKDIRVVGGAPAYYTVQSGSAPGSGTIGSFGVNQVKNLGQWVSAGSFTLTGGYISVMLHTRGVDFDGANHAHLAAAAARADCS
ncbi:hypothetical protein AB0K43_24155 [Kitasatospora sp. NPDC049258]|uniref:hypothetical protein n=1 Tax=Kitasatospora sp. NPDC049258 TaxID=3155394 RepID=UPI003420D9DE